MAFITEIQDIAPQIMRPLLGFLNYLFLGIVCKIPSFKYTGYFTDEQNKDMIEQVLDDQNRENVYENYGQIFEDWNCSERNSEEVERLNFNGGDSEEVERLNFNWECSEREEEDELEPLDTSSSSVCSTTPFSSKLSYNQVCNNEAGSQQFEDCNSLHINPSKGNMNMKMDGWVCKESMRLRKNYYRELQALKHTPLSEYRRYESEDDEWQPTRFYELLEFWRKKEKNWT
ncbi:hypothetical protein SUGI_0320100 [Cryptomeria japonica]|nr:hypothetical protein SUGI_0320100 [Cryptomeria japonica]